MTTDNTILPASHGKWASHGLCTTLFLSSGYKKNWKIQTKVLGNKNEEAETSFICWFFFFSFSIFFHSVFLCYRFYILSFSIDLYFYSMYFFYKYSFSAPFFASFASVLTTLFPSSNFLLSLCEYQTVLIAYSDQWTYVNLSCP